MAIAGIPSTILQQVAGHKSIVTTQRYIGRLNTRDLARLPHGFSDRYGRVAG